MKKKYTSPLFAELELELEDVLFVSAFDNVGGDDDFGGGDPEGGFDAEEDFVI